MHTMKHLTLVAALPMLALSSCQLSSEKAKEEAEAGGSIPPPKNQQLTDAVSEEPASQELLPDLSTKDEQGEVANKELNVIQSGDFIFKDPLKDLPTKRDLATPPTPVMAAPEEKEPESNLDSEITEPLVQNP